MRHGHYTNLVFSHSRDCDGVASGALLLKCLGGRETIIRLIDYDYIDELIDWVGKAGSLGVKRVYVADLALAGYYIEDLVEAVGRAVRSGVGVIWLDHHRTKPSHLERVRSMGVSLHIDTSKCSGEIVSEVVCKHGLGGFLLELARDTDFLVFKHHLSKPLAEVIAYYEATRKRDKLERLCVKMSDGVYWDEEINEDWEAARSLISEEEEEMVNRSLVKEVKGVRLVVSYASKLLPTHTAPLVLINRFSADLAAVILGSKDFILARRRGVDIDCGFIASRIGGGGHKHIAGGWFMPGSDTSTEAKRDLLMDKLVDIIMEREQRLP